MMWTLMLRRQPKATKPDDTNARAYAAVMGVDWSKVKSWREVDGAIEFEMEDE